MTFFSNKDHVHNKIWQLAWPAVLTNVTVPLLGLVDLTIVGHMGDTACIGAVAVGSMIFNVMYWLFGFLRMGTAGRTAQALGQNNIAAIQHERHLLMRQGALLGIGLLLIQIPLRYLALWLMGPSAEVSDMVEIYFNICIWGAPAMLCLYGLTGWLIGMQDTRSTMLVALVQNVSNIFMSLFLVIGLGMQIEGVALGTLLAQWAGLFVSWQRAYRRERKAVAENNLTGQSTEHTAKTPETKRKKHASSDWYLFSRSFCLVSVNLFFTAAGARQGDLMLAVNTLLMTLFTIFSFLMDGVAFSAEALCGQACGAGNDREFWRLCRALTTWGAASALLFSACYLLGGPMLLHLLTDRGEVVEAASEFMPWAVCIPLCGASAFVLDGIFVGLCRSASMFASVAVAALLFFAFWFGLQPLLGNHALWIALLVFLSMRGVVLWIILARSCAVDS